MFLGNVHRLTYATADSLSLMGRQHAVPWSDERVLYCRECLWYACQPGTMLQKAVITTPMKDGKFDADAVPEGASVWITVTEPSSPLHGRPILITKRPDGLFVLTGGGGVGGDARRHMILTGSPRKTKRDLELEGEVADAKSYNAPLLAARSKATAESREELAEATSLMLEALGIGDIDADKMIGQKAAMELYVADALGTDVDSAKVRRITDLIMKNVVAANKSVNERAQRERTVAAAKKMLKAGAQEGEVISESSPEEEPEDEQVLTYPPMFMALPDVEEIADLVPAEQELAIVRHFDQQVEEFFDADRDVGTEEMSVEEIDLAVPPPLVLGETLDPLNLNDQQTLMSAVEAVESYWTKRKQVEEITRRLKKLPLAEVTASTVQAIRNEDIQGVSIEDVAAQMEEQQDRDLRDNTAMALYDAIGEHWNDDVSLADVIGQRGRRDSSMQFHVNAGASSALSALGKELLGVRLNVSKIITDGNIDMAAAVMALEVARQMGTTSDRYDQVVEKVKMYNAVNQRATEVRALEQHARYARQYQEIQRQKAGAELLDRVKISSLETDNVIAQRTNLGSAMGSLQASATFYDYLERMKGSRRAPVITVNVGGNVKTAEGIVQKLGLKRDYDVDLSDVNDIKVNIGLSSLSRYVQGAPDVARQESAYEAIKTNMDGVSEDADGNLVVNAYSVPGWRDSYTDAAGEVQPYRWRVEQRNDIEWLREATKKTPENPEGVGGGLITRVTGAGKTNTALGFFNHKIAEDAEYKGLVVVPRGRAAQWAEEAGRFSDIPVVLIPDGTAKAEVDRILSQSEGGSVYVMGHREASRSHEMIGLMQTDSEMRDQRFGGLVIDEPQELQARGRSGNIGAQGQRLMKLPFSHRVGLTATPARRSPVEAYDLIKWTQGTGKPLGSKAAFNRTFSGFGSGTNAQDAAINKLFFDTVRPYISGDRLTSPDFKVERSDIDVARTEGQRARQMEIEAAAAGYVARRRQEIMTEARQDPRHPLRTSEGWERTLGQRATAMARQEVMSQHRENADGGSYQDNGKLLRFRQEIMNSDPSSKHVVYIDSATQRRAVGRMLRDMGMTTRQVKNIASSTGTISGRDMAARAKAFRDDPEARVIMIDVNSSSGYNLQAGDALHVLGSPDNAATYLQSQGRVARMPRQGDVDIKTYRYGDSPTEQAHWNDLDAQMKVLRAASPAMFV